MFDYIKKQIELIFNANQFSIFTVALFSVITFFIWMTTSALFVFQQFKFYEIIFVSFTFFILLFTLTALFLGDFFKQQLKANIHNILLSCIVIFIMILIGDSENSGFSSYYHTFPLLETEVGLGWHQDSVFHASIIQSILNYGYPSIGQHGSPLIVYHVLSHYMDALILFITGLEVYDSYGLFFHFKTFLFVSSTVFFLAYICKETTAYVFLLTLILITPIMIGTWHGIGSHGLWFTSIILILSAPKLFNMLIKDEKNSTKDFMFFFLLIVVISLGKVSTGFMYAAFIGMYLLLKQPKNKLVYFLGIGWIAFFLIYKKLMIRNVTTTEGFDFTWLSFDSIYLYLADRTHAHFQLQTSIFAMIFLLSAVAFIFRNKKNTRIAIAAILNFLILVFITRISIGFSKQDVWYFYYGLSSILIIFTLLTLSFNLKLYQIEQYPKSTIDHRLIKVSLLLSAVYLSSFFFQPNLKMQSKFLKQEFIDNKFSKINTLLEDNDKISFIKILNYPADDYIPKKLDQPMRVFRKDLLAFLSANKIPKQQVSLYLPKEIYEKDFAKFKGPKWARGMLIYAITGVPLVNGLGGLRTNYGYADYTKGSLWINQKDFKPEETCNAVYSKSIVMTKSFLEPEFSLYQCKGNDSSSLSH